MTRVYLIDGYYVEIDLMNYTLMQEYVGEDKDGAPKIGHRRIGYFKTLPEAVDKMLKLLQLSKTSEIPFTLGEYVKTIDRINKTAVQAICKALRED